MLYMCLLVSEGTYGKNSASNTYCQKSNSNCIGNEVKRNEKTDVDKVA